MGPGVVSFTDYPGSNRVRDYLVPTPYVRYRGPFLRATREGVQGELLDAQRVSLNLTFGASVPVSSRDDPARVGMPNLSPLLEVGPQLSVHLWRNARGSLRVDARVPLRFAFAISADPHAAGAYVAPGLNLDLFLPRTPSAWNFGVLTAALFADQQYNANWYQVAPLYATAARPAYRAPSGYAGTELLASTSRRLRHLWFGAFVRVIDLDGAAFATSPLMRRRMDFAGGLGMAWIVGESHARVEADE